jgi:hypothetical protein
MGPFDVVALSRIGTKTVTKRAQKEKAYPS